MYDVLVLILSSHVILPSVVAMTRVAMLLWCLLRAMWVLTIYLFLESDSVTVFLSSILLPCQSWQFLPDLVSGGLPNWLMHH